MFNSILIDFTCNKSDTINLWQMKEKALKLTEPKPFFGHFKFKDRAACALFMPVGHSNPEKAKR